MSIKVYSHYVIIKITDVDAPGHKCDCFILYCSQKSNKQFCDSNGFKFIFGQKNRQLILNLHARYLQNVTVPIIKGNIIQMDITYIYEI